MRPGEFVQMEEDKEVIIKTLVNHTQLFKLHRNQNLHFQDFVSNEDLVLEPTPAVPGWLSLAKIIQDHHSSSHHHS